jgi:hypothetical protein
MVIFFFWNEWSGELIAILKKRRGATKANQEVQPTKQEQSTWGPQQQNTASKGWLTLPAIRNKSRVCDPRSNHGPKPPRKPSVNKEV